MNSYIERLNKPTLIGATLSVVLVLGYVDYVTGPEYSLSLFYILPVMLITWHGGTVLGVLLSIVAVFVWQYAHSLAGEIFSSPLVPVWNTSIRLGVLLLVVWQIHYSRRMLERQRSLAQVDSLTGVLNSRAFHELAASKLKHSLHNMQPSTLVYFDLDGFKTVNDWAGHSTGDKVLVSFVRALKSSIRAEDIVARLGGDEFVLLLPNTPLDVAEKRVAQIQQHFAHQAQAHNLPVTVSAGLAASATSFINLDAWIRVADDNMYQAKRLGKNQFYSSTFNS